MTVTPISESDIVAQLRQKREERMRLGQNTAEIFPVPSSPEVRVALIPLLEGEYDECMRAVAALDVPETIAGASVMDRHEKREVIVRASRDTSDYTKRAFKSVDQMMEVLEPEDVNFLYEAYLDMVREISPAVDELDDEEIELLKKVFEEMPWKDLSGKQVYALTRFLSRLAPEQLMGKILGRLSIP